MSGNPFRQPVQAEALPAVGYNNGCPVCGWHDAFISVCYPSLQCRVPDDVAHRHVECIRCGTKVIERRLPADVEAPLEPAHVEAMLARLSRHFRCQVRPIDQYCERLWFWFDRRKKLQAGSEYERERSRVQDLDWVALQIRKSNLLARLLYGWEDIRTEQCPQHKGKWSGIGTCDYGCAETGWLPNELVAAIRSTAAPDAATEERP